METQPPPIAIPVMSQILGTWRISIERIPFTGSEIEAIYGSIADVWPRKLARLGFIDVYRKLSRRLIREGLFCGLPGAARVLDCGVGAGALSYALSVECPMSLQLYGIDLAPKMLVSARSVLHKAGGEITLKQGDVRALPYRERCFDFVMAAHVIEHFPDPLIALREMLRVLKPGAPLLILVTRKSMLGMLVHLKWRVHRLTEPELKRWFEACEITDIRLYPLEGPIWCRELSLACMGRKPDRGK